MQAKTNEVALLRERLIKIRIASAHKHVDVAGPKSQPPEGDIVGNAVVIRYVEQGFKNAIRLNAWKHRARNAIDRRICCQTKQGVKTGGHIGREGLTQTQLEVAIQENKITNIDGQIGHGDRARHPGQTNPNVDVFQELQAILQPVWRRR